MKKYDVIVVGGGIAGLRSAIESAKKVDTAIISQVHPLRSHTLAAQGGVNAALGNATPDDSWEKHALDTIKGSDYLADQDAVEIMTKEAIEIIYEMEHWGTPFSRTSEGKIAQRPFGGAGYPRTCYGADRIGHYLLHTLYEKVVEQKIKIYSEFLVTDLVLEDGKCVGVIAINILNNEIEAFLAKAVIFATGGIGRIYGKSTNSLISSGYGIAIAYEAGVSLKDMEFVQFHPTSLYGTNILITEAARGEGGYLLNSKGERFMKNYAPEKMELAPRDIVARAMQTEINEGRGFENQYLHLDLRHLGKEKILERLPEIREISINFAGIDPIEEPIPVQPCQHYSMGGIDTDKDGKTKIEGFYACGECACVSVHGANRLGGNSLLEGLVFGRRAGKSASEYAFGKEYFGKSTLIESLREREKKISELFKKGNKGFGSYIRKKLGEVMHENVGIFREKNGLEKAQSTIKRLKEIYETIGIENKEEYNLELVRTLELDGMLLVAEVITLCALKREESRGSHYRTDFKDRDDKNFLKHSISFFTKEGPKIEYADVFIDKYKPTERKY
ncbi:MAG: FAD-binding protein [Candidatus Thermoplasmatota archaeon]